MRIFQTIIDAEALHESLADPDLRIVDCRFDLLNKSAGSVSYRLGHIPGAIYANLDLDLASAVTATSGRHPLPSPGIFASKLGQWGIDRSTQVVVYDDVGGAIASRLWWMLRWLGHDAVAVLDGGIPAWEAAGFAVSSQESDCVARDFIVQQAKDSIVTTAALVSELAAPEPLLLLDARAEKRFAGEIEPIDDKAGHIPGARNFPFSRCLKSDGLWRSPAELQHIFHELGYAPQGSSTIAMCGSGVTACQIILAAVRANVAEPRLYVGSWSEWIRSADRPIASGLEINPPGP